MRRTIPIDLNVAEGPGEFKERKKLLFPRQSVGQRSEFNLAVDFGKLQNAAIAVNMRAF